MSASYRKSKLQIQSIFSVASRCARNLKLNVYLFPPTSYQLSHIFVTVTWGTCRLKLQSSSLMQYQRLRHVDKRTKCFRHVVLIKIFIKNFTQFVRKIFLTKKFFLNIVILVLKIITFLFLVKNRLLLFSIVNVEIVILFGSIGRDMQKKNIFLSSNFICLIFPQFLVLGVACNGEKLYGHNAEQNIRASKTA